jgi:hypothetical protein
MTETAEAPATYSIEQLLTRSVQPFPDLPPDEFEVLKASIKSRGLLNKVQLTSDGFLWDGHQRCKALLALGRKRIRAEDVTVNAGIDRANMLGAALASNTVRRMLTSADKADRMHKLAGMGWSQRRIAREFSVTQAAVSQLMAAYPPDGGTPDVQVTEGDDGKTYTSIPRGARPKQKPWQPSGIAMRSVRKTRKFIANELPAGLDDWERAELAEELENLQEAIGEFLANMETM